MDQPKPETFNLKLLYLPFCLCEQFLTAINSYILPLVPSLRQFFCHPAVSTAQVKDARSTGYLLQNPLHVGLQAAPAGRERPGELLIEFFVQLDESLCNRRVH